VRNTLLYVAGQGNCSRVPGSTWRSQSARQRTHEGLGGERGHASQLPYDQQAENQRQAIALPTRMPTLRELFKDVIERQGINLLSAFDRRQGGI
jgi:hypothetical protein